MNTSANTYFSIPAALKSFPTTSVGCAPLLSHFLAASSLIEKPLGSRFGSYVPISSINLPSLGESGICYNDSIERSLLLSHSS